MLADDICCSDGDDVVESDTLTKLLPADVILRCKMRENSPK